MPDWIVVLIALVPVLAIVGGGLGALLTFRVQGRQAGAATLTAEAAHETATVAGRKAAVEEMSELRQHWSSVVTNVMADNATVRADNAALKADVATLHLAHAADIVAVEAKLTVSAAKQAITDLKLTECEALNRAMLERVQEIEQAHRGHLAQSHPSGERTGGEESARRG